MSSDMTMWSRCWLLICSTLKVNYIVGKGKSTVFDHFSLSGKVVLIGSSISYVVLGIKLV